MVIFSLADQCSAAEEWFWCCRNNRTCGARDSGHDEGYR